METIKLNWQDLTEENVTKLYLYGDLNSTHDLTSKDIHREGSANDANSAQVTIELNNFYDYITTNLDIHLKFLPDNNVITSEVLDKIINIFESHKDMINNCESCLVHHDLADHNIIYNTEKK